MRRVHKHLHRPKPTMLPAYRSLCASTRRFALQPPLPRTSRFSTVASCTSCSRLQSLSICPNIPSRQPSSKFQTRPFSQSTSRALRPTYFPNNAGGNPKGNGFFSNLKRTINDLPSSVILWTIIGLNGAVYVVYNIGYSSYVRFSPSLLIFIYRLPTAKRRSLHFDSVTKQFHTLLEELERRPIVSVQTKCGPDDF